MVVPIRGVEVLIDLGLSIVLAHIVGPVGVALGTLGGIALARFPGFLIIGGRAVGIRPLTLLRRSVLPHLIPLAADSAVLLALRGFADRSVPGLVGDVVAGAITYVVVYFAVGATSGERHRALLAVARYLPKRWRPSQVARAGRRRGPGLAGKKPSIDDRRRHRRPEIADAPLTAATGRLYSFLKRHRSFDVVVVWISRRVRESPPSSRLNHVLGPLRARFRGEMKAEDVLRVVDALEAQACRSGSRVGGAWTSWPDPRPGATTTSTWSCRISKATGPGPATPWTGSDTDWSRSSRDCG